MISWMSAMWGLAGVLVTAVAGVVTAKVTSGGAERAAQAPARLEMEAEAFSNAAVYWKEKIAGLESDLSRVNTKLDNLMRREEASEQRETQLTERVRILEQVLADNQIPVPPWHVGP